MVLWWCFQFSQCCWEGRVGVAHVCPLSANTQIYDGACGGAFKKARGDIVYYGDVAAKVMGWDITLRKGSNKHGKPLLHIGKSAKLWDKNTKVIITVSMLSSSLVSIVTHRAAGYILARPSVILGSWWACQEVLIPCTN